MSSFTQTSQRQTSLVFGYIRLYIQPLLLKNENIPHEIIKLCQEYHFLYDWIDFSVYDRQFFDRKMDKLKQILFAKKDTYSNVMFSKQGFNKGIHFWKLKCIEYGGDCCDIIGIASTIQSNSWLNNIKGSTYYTFSGENAWYFENRVQGENIERKSKTWATNDELIVKLDCNEWTFDVFINEISPNQKCFETFNIMPNKTYYPCIGFPSTKAKYEVLLD
eukprot:221461_1